MRGHDHTDPNSRRDADRDGVPDHRDPVVRAPGADPGITREIRKDAYERGRADERSRHKRNPLLTILVALLAVFGLIVLGLFIYNGGSFTETGRDLDTATSRAADETREVTREVADEAGEGLQDVGRRVEQEGEAGTTPPPAQTPPPAEAPARR